MTEDARNLARRVQDQTVDSAREFLGASLARLKDRLRDDRSQLEDLAEQLRQEDARARIQELVDSYSAIEGSIEEAARDLGLEDTIDETAPHEPEPGEQDAVGQAAQGAQDAVAGAVDQAASAAGQVAGQVAGQIGQVAENLPGGHLLGRSTDEAGRTVQRVVDETGDIIETTLDESGELVDENPAGSLTDLPAEEESTTEEGNTLRTVRDESGTLIELRIGEDGGILDLEILPDAE
jgi:hypothetical protein